MPTPATVFQITDGQLALVVVDRAATGYTDAWQAPGGKTAATAALADYGTGQNYGCQITSGKLTASKQSTTTDVPATFCAPGESRSQAQLTSYALDAEFLQDVTVRDGISAFLYENDAREAYFLLALNAGTTPPRAIGRVNLHAAGFGGAPRANLTDSVSFDCTRKPDILFGTSASNRLITGAGTVTDTPAAGEVLEEAARANVLRATGGDARLSGARSISARRAGGNTAGTAIRLELKVVGAGKRAQGVVVPRGPIMLVEGPTVAHRIPFRHGQGRRYAMQGEQLAGGGIARRRRANRRPGVFVPGRGFYRSVKHPGTQGKRPVRRAFQSHAAEAGSVGLLVFSTAARRHITGS
jgi:hypothetical protein